MTAATPFESTSTGPGDAAGREKRPWRPMTLEYINDVGTVMKSTHKSGMMGETDIFSNKRLA